MKSGLLLFSFLLCFCVATAPFAPFLKASAGTNEQIVLKLLGFDKDGDSLTATITTTPEIGELYSLSSVFNDHGHEPKLGEKIAAGHVVSSKSNRVIYVPPANTKPPLGKWATFSYTVSDDTATSAPGIVWLLPPSGAVVETRFDFGTAGWTVENNGAGGVGIVYEPSARGSVNHYVFSTDDEIHSEDNGSDSVQWHFKAPSAFHGNHAVAYGGSLEFTLAASAGDFAQLNAGAEMVALECSSCDSGKGLRLVTKLGEGPAFDGTATSFSFLLKETAGWRVDPLHSFGPWAAPSQCQMVEVLAGLSGVTILGDYTKWVESVALDDVRLVSGGGVPRACAGIYY